MPPPKALTDHLASVVGEAATARYTDVPGLPPLRAALAADMGKFYGARIAEVPSRLSRGVLNQKSASAAVNSRISGNTWLA